MMGFDGMLEENAYWKSLCLIEFFQSAGEGGTAFATTWWSDSPN
jgi:hypothetical protein